MVIRGEDLRTLNFIQNANPQRFRDTGYDVSVGKIFVPWDDDNNAGGTFVEEYEVPPQGVVLIFSEEAVELPRNVVGFALPKTSLCEEGLLVLNTGIVDPGYRGMLSGTTINFRKSPVVLKKGDPFLRLVFQTMDPIVDLAFWARQPKTGPVTPDEAALYRFNKQQKALQYPHTFLNVPKTVKEVSKVVIDKDREWFFKLFAAVAVVVGVSTVTNILVTNFSKPWTDGKVVIAPPHDNSPRVDELQAAIREMRERIQQLESKADTKNTDEIARPKTSVPQPSPTEAKKQ